MNKHRHCCIFSALLFLNACSSQIFDFPGGVPTPPANTINCTIDPNASVYGIPFGASEKKLVETFGSPTGVVHMNISRKAILYGTKHAFLTFNGKMYGVIVGEPAFYGPFDEQIEFNDVFDSINPIIMPGIKFMMTFEDVNKLLNNKMREGYRSAGCTQIYETDKTYCEFHFQIFYVNNKPIKRLSGIKIERKDD